MNFYPLIKEKKQTNFNFLSKYKIWFFPLLMNKNP